MNPEELTKTLINWGLSEQVSESLSYILIVLKDSEGDFIINSDKTALIC